MGSDYGYYTVYIFIVVPGMTKIKMSNQSSDGSGVSPGGSGSSEFVERRRASLERYLNRTAQHPVLCIDPDFRQFLESG